MPRRKLPGKTRLRTRNQGGQFRFYADLRDFARVGGRIEALKPPGSKWANVANHLLAERLRELKRLQHDQDLGIKPATAKTGLTEYVAHHLDAKGETGRVTFKWLEYVEAQLHAARDFWCPVIAGADTGDGEPARVSVAWIRSRRGRYGSTSATCGSRRAVEVRRFRRARFEPTSTACRNSSAVQSRKGSSHRASTRSAH